MFAIVAIRRDEVDTALCEPLAQRIGVVSAVGDHALWLLPRTAFGLRDFDFGERGLRKRNFSRRGTFEPNSQRKTAASRSQEKDTGRAKIATPRRSATPTKCPLGRPGCKPMDGRACPCAASALAAVAQSTPTAPHSTTRTASCSCKKCSKPPTSGKVSSLRPNLFMKHALGHIAGSPSAK
jgi:hypothetical protein